MKAYREYAVITLITLCMLSINSHWGLPSANRLALIGGAEVLQSNLPAIERTKTQAKKIGTNNLLYSDRIHFSVREFLISPFAGDDNFTLNAIRQLNPYQLRFDPHFYVYGGGFIYTGAVFLQISAWLGYTKLIPDATFYLLNPHELGNIFAVLRFMIVLFATAGLAFTYHLANNHFGKSTARLTSLILLSVPLIHQASRTIEPHIFVTPFFLIAFSYLIAFAQYAKTKDLILSAIFSGFCVGIQVVSGYIAIVFLTAVFVRYNTHRLPIREAIRTVLIYGIIAAIAGLAINPFYMLNFDGFMQDFSRGTGNQLLNTLKVWAPYQLSTFLLLLFILTPIYHLFHPGKDTFTTLALPCIFASILIYIFISNYHMPYIITAIPLVAILCVRMLQNVFHRLETNTRRFFAIATILCFLIFPVARSTYYVMNFTSTNRELAGAWINNNIPNNATIAIRFPPSVWDCVPFQFYNYDLTDYRDIKEGKLPEYVVLSDVDLPEPIRSHYGLAKEYLPHPIFGYRFQLEGELDALIGKTIRIYARRPESTS